MRTVIGITIVSSDQLLTGSQSSPSSLGSRRSTGHDTRTERKESRDNRSLQTCSSLHRSTSSSRDPCRRFWQCGNPEAAGSPVVLTQRRPKQRDRGFIRAYAPLLADVGIDQEVFLDFLDKLNRTIQPNPWLNAINLASLAGLAVPTPFTFVISVAVRMAVKAAQEVDSRSKGNTFFR